MGPAMRARILLRSLLLQAGFDRERMQALGFAWSIDPWLEKVWAGDPAGLAEARRRHLAHFNAQPYAAAYVLGLSCRFEEELAAAPAAERPARIERLARLKTASACGLSGSADAFFWGALRPALALAALLLAFLLPREGGARFVWPAAVYVGAWNAAALLTRVAGLRAGYEGGEKGVALVCALPVAEAALKLRLAALGLGAVVAAVALFSLPASGRPAAFAALLVCATVPRVGPLAAAGVLGAGRALWGGA